MQQQPNIQENLCKARNPQAASVAQPKELTSKRLSLRCVIALCVLAAVLAGAVAIYNAWEEGLFLPGFITWHNTDYATDLDGDGYLEELQLKDRHLSVYSQGELACKMPDDWFVSDVFTGDLNSDGVMELVCLTWKQGSYGSSKPFWVKNDTRDFSQHVFIFHYKDGQLEQEWLSSDIGMEVDRMSLDANKRVHLHTTAGEDHVLEWQEWGLAYLDENNPSMRQADYACTTFLAVGDNIAHTGVLDGAKVEDESYDFSPLYKNVSQFISDAPTAAVIQETPLVYDKALVSGEFPLFATPCSMGNALANAGFDVVCSATNHAGDAGAIGIADTLNYWKNEQPNVTVLGLNSSQETAGNPVFRDADGVRMALFDYTFGLNDSSKLAANERWMVDSLADNGGAVTLLSQLQEAEDAADISICFLHVGDEYAQEPSAEEEALISRVIDAGADAVICSHPHVVQQTQTVTTAAGNSAVVCFSLGNFVASQPFSSTVLGAAIELDIEKPLYTPGKEGYDAPEPTRIAGVKVIPTVCHASSEGTSVYTLADYTDDLAKAHFVNTLEKDSVSLASLRQQWLALSAQ